MAFPILARLLTRLRGPGPRPDPRGGPPDADTSPPAASATLLSDQPSLKPRGPRPQGLEHGVNLIGYARGGLGLGENLRRFAEALADARIPFALIDYAEGLGDRGTDARVDRWIGSSNPYPTNIFFINADQMAGAREHFGERFFRQRRNIGFWFWELERFPDAWLSALDLVDEVWTASDFVRRAILTCTTKPVHRIALPVEVFPERVFSREEYDLPADRFVFLFNFDFHSFAQRKNPMAAIDAFRRALPADDQRALLLIKSINGARSPAQFERLREAIGDDPRILVRDGWLDHAGAVGLLSVCDAYLSLHRSEGFGLGMAEAMCLEKPVVATAYSGNLDFMTPDNSGLVRHRLIPLAADDYPWGEGQHWADPDLDHAAQLIRALVDDRDLSVALARAGAESIRQTHDRAACIASMRVALAPA